MFLPLTVTLVSAPGLAVFLVASSSFFTWATASIKPLNKRAPNRIRFISDVVPFSREYTTRAAAAPAGFTSGNKRSCESLVGEAATDISGLRTRDVSIRINSDSAYCRHRNGGHTDV